MMKRNFFVFDTNALISAFLVKNSTSDKAFRKAIERGALAISEAAITEFLEVLWRPKFDTYFTPEERIEIIKEVERYAVTFSASEHINASTDPDDNLFLELALAANADCIISGDPHLRTLHPFRGIPIYSASDFLRLF
jgi:putative PIN family toxin of toxin-antitoxin system